MRWLLKGRFLLCLPILNLCMKECVCENRISSDSEKIINSQKKYVYKRKD